MRGLLILSDGFEDTEALTTRDVLIRGGLDVVTASITDTQEVISSFGVKIFADLLLKKIKSTSEYEFIILPGGGRGTKNLADCEFLKAYLDEFILHNKIVAAICAAPSILGKYGYLDNRKFTCFSGFENGINGTFTQKEVEIDENIITGRSMAYSIPFALAIVEKLQGKEKRIQVEISLQGLDKK